MLLDNYYKMVYASAEYVARHYSGTGTDDNYPANLNSNPVRATDGVYRDYVNHYFSGHTLHNFFVTPSNIVLSQTDTSTSWSNNYYCPVMLIGSGTTPVSASDYCMESEITTVSGVTVVRSYNSLEGTVTFDKVMKNTSSVSITVSEVGLMSVGWYAAHATDTSTKNRFNYLYYREVLETPITVGAGETFTVSVTHQFAMPTA